MDLTQLDPAVVLTVQLAAIAGLVEVIKATGKVPHSWLPLSAVASGILVFAMGALLQGPAYQAYLVVLTGLTSTGFYAIVSAAGGNTVVNTTGDAGVRVATARKVEVYE